MPAEVDGSGVLMVSEAQANEARASSLRVAETRHKACEILYMCKELAHMAWWSSGMIPS